LARIGSPASPPARALGWLALGLLVAGSACAPPRPRNLVLVSIDTLRPDLLGCYGHERPTSPALDTLAAGGVLFETALAAAPWTLPSHASLLTGLYPSRHGVRRAGAVLPDDVVTWAAWLRERGFTTSAIVNSHWLGRETRLERGFDGFVWVEENVRRRRPSRVGELAARWLAEGPAEPFFLFLHFYDVHSDYASLPSYEERFRQPYDGPADGSTRQLRAVREGRASLGPDDVRHLLDLYAAGVRQMDDALARLLRALRDLGLRENTLLVVTSDHGEEFLEHEGVLHGRTQYEEVLRVPLILAGPGVPAGVRVREPVSLVDVMPTALTLLALPAPAGLDGLDLGPLFAGAGATLGERILFAEADWRNEEDDVLRAVRSGRYKLLVDRRSGARRLFDLDRDPGERVDVQADHPELARQLHAALEAFARGAREVAPPAELTPEERERLQALGYL